jgi:hypothetical protein
MNVIYLILITFLLVMNHVVAFAWNDGRTHKDISRYAAERSILGPCSNNGIQPCNVLMNFGYVSGLSEEFTWNSASDIVVEWLARGSQQEDGSSRSLNHFHNPLKQWDQAGLADIASGQSSLLWAQNYYGTQQSMTNDWSWQRTRKLFNLALTSPDPDMRSMYFAQTFRGLGQQMHLLQDMAVPYHVRNDAHPLGAVMGWTCSVFGNSNCAFFEIWAANEYYDLATLNAATPNPFLPALIQYNPSVDDGISYSGLAPITWLYDSSIYNGGGQSVSLLTATPFALVHFGLSEYTNANFFSDDTINLSGVWTTAAHKFPHPAMKSTNLIDLIASNALPTTVIAEDGVQDAGLWVKKIGDGETFDHLAKPGYTTSYLRDTFGSGYVYDLSFVLDETCHRDYAEKLLPLAVGYSAELLNYFFRGDISLELGGGTAEEFVVRNNHAAEDMQGKISLYADNSDGTRVLAGEAGNIFISRNGTSMPVVFSSPSTSFPYALVFEGKMGNEEGAVAGRVGRKRWWREEWDKGLTGNHIWIQFPHDKAHALQLGEHGPDAWGTVMEISTDIADGKLVMENYSIYYDTSVNQTWIRDAVPYPNSSTTPYCTDSTWYNCYPFDFGLEFPLPITRNTVIRIKVDEMGVEPPISQPVACDFDLGIGHYQGIRVTFDNNERIFFTIPGPGPGGDTMFVPLGQEFSFKIFDKFAEIGKVFTEPLSIVSINVVQQLMDRCPPSSNNAPIGHRQRMVIDYIRIED